MTAPAQQADTYYIDDLDGLSDLLDELDALLADAAETGTPPAVIATLHNAVQNALYAIQQGDEDLDSDSEDDGEEG